MVCIPAQLGRVGHAEVVRYLSPPLPLTAPSPQQVTPTMQAKHTYSKSKPSLMKLLNCGPDCPVLLCTCVGDNFHSLFSVCSLSENREVQGGQFQTFDEWSHANSMLTCTKLECREIPEAVQIDSALIRGALYLCVVCSHQLMLYELPATDAVSCKWMDNPVIRKSSCKILHAKLSPYIPGQVVVLKEQGELCIYQPCEGVTKVRSAADKASPALPPYTCLFGAHPRQVLWVEGGRLFSVDLRSAEIPMHSAYQPVPLRGGITCVLKSLHPFHLFVTTRRQLMLIDLRQPEEPLLTVLHHLVDPPVAMTSLQLQDKTSLVLVSSSQDNVVFCCNSVPSCPVLSTSSAHVVCCLSDVLKCLKRSALCARARGQIRHRFRQSTSGAVLLTLEFLRDTYGVLTLTELGDMFHQCWQYRQSQHSNSSHHLTKAQYRGMELWIHEAYALSKPQLRSKSLLVDMSSIARYLVSCGEDCSQPSSNVPSVPTQELDELRTMHHQLIPSSQQDITMVMEWGPSNMQELFEDDPASNDSADHAVSEHCPSHPAYKDSVHTTTGETRTPQKRKSGF